MITTTPTVLVMLLRLRQTCSHPALIQEDARVWVRPNETEETYEKENEAAQAAHAVSQEFVDLMKAKLKQVALDRLALEKEVCSPLRCV